MLKYRLIGSEDSIKGVAHAKLNDVVYVSVDSTNPNRASAISYSGNPEVIAEIQEWLTYEYGAFGHSIGNNTTPIDLDAAMHSKEAKQFKPKIVVGAELVKNYDPGIPEGAVT